jgi:hypothetical protein
MNEVIFLRFLQNNVCVKGKVGRVEEEWGASLVDSCGSWLMVTCKLILPPRLPFYMSEIFHHKKLKNVIFYMQLFTYLNTKSHGLHKIRICAFVSRLTDMILLFLCFKRHMMETAFFVTCVRLHHLLFKEYKFEEYKWHHLKMGD